jgi:polysaccharide export outer membrane protein
MKMNKSLLFLWLGISTLFTSCITTKDLIYLQKKNGDEVVVPISTVASKPYRLQTNDVLSITIKADDPKLVTIFSPTNQGEVGKSESGLYFDGFTVDDHGNIRIPVLGEINVIGFTVEEIRTKMEKQLLADYFNKEANIFVTVKLAGFKYTTSGEIGSIGTKTVFQDHLNIMEAIANSGDIKITGNRKAVTIIRQLPSGIEMHDIDLTDINVMQSPYYYLQPNDFIYVKPLKKNAWETFKTGMEGFTSIVSLITLGTTLYLLFKN